MAEILNYSFSGHNFLACMSKELSKGQYCASKLERKEEKNRLEPQNFISGIVCRSKKHKNPVTGDSQLFSLHYCIPFFLSDVLELVAMQPGSKPHHLIILLLIAIEKRASGFATALNSCCPGDLRPVTMNLRKTFLLNVSGISCYKGINLYEQSAEFWF